MSPATPFIDAESGGLDLEQITAEAYPLVGLIALFAGLALIPVVLMVFLGRVGPLGMVLNAITQFVVAVGAGIVLMYVIARGIQLAEA